MKTLKVILIALITILILTAGIKVYNNKVEINTLNNTVKQIEAVTNVTHVEYEITYTNELSFIITGDNVDNNKIDTIIQDQDFTNYNNVYSFNRL